MFDRSPPPSPASTPGPPSGREPPPGETTSKAHRVGELRLAGRDGGAGLAPRNKYAEGYPGKALLRRLRDSSTWWETIAIDRASSPSAPASPTCSPTPAQQANQASSSACCEPGDTIMGMSLAEGGHLTHGICAEHERQVVQGGQLRPGRRGSRSTTTRWSAWRTSTKPRLIIAGASAMPAHRLRALRASGENRRRPFMVDMAHYAGLIAAGRLPNAAHADVVTSTTHKTPARPAAAASSDERREHRQKINISAIFPASRAAR